MISSFHNIVFLPNCADDIKNKSPSSLPMPHKTVILTLNNVSLKTSDD